MNFSLELPENAMFFNSARIGRLFSFAVLYLVKINNDAPSPRLTPCAFLSNVRVSESVSKPHALKPLRTEGVKLLSEPPVITNSRSLFLSDKTAIDIAVADETDAESTIKLAPLQLKKFAIRPLIKFEIYPGNVSSFVFIDLA